MNYGGKQMAVKCNAVCIVLKKKIDKCSKAIAMGAGSNILFLKSNTVAFDYLKNMKKCPTLKSDWPCFLGFKISIEQSVLGAHGFSTYFFHHSQLWIA